MPDLQEDVQKEIFAIVEKFANFTMNELKTSLRDVLAEYERLKKDIKNQVGETVRLGHDGDAPINKVSVQELVETGNTIDTTALYDHDELFDEIMKEYGIKYAVNEKPMLDEKGEQIFNDSKCKYEMEEDGETPKLDYSKCKVEVDPETKEIKMGEDGKPILAPDSPKPTKILAENSPKPEPMKEYVVFYEAKNAQVLKEAYQEYERRRTNEINKENQQEQRREEAQQKKEEQRENKLDKKFEQEKEKYNTPFNGKTFTEKNGAENVEQMEVSKPQRFKDLAEKNGITDYAMDVTKGKNGLKYTVTYNKKDKEKMELIGNTSRANNVKKMISKNDKRKESINKPSPEKHHNRGAQSL